MRFHDRSAFLVLHCAERSKKSSLFILENAGDVFSIWNAATRLSPIFPVTRQDGRHSPLSFKFEHEWTVFFIGPVHPESVPITGNDNAQIWLSLGLFNIVLATQDAGLARRLKTWTTKNSVPYEKWNVKDGEIGTVETWAQPSPPGNWRDEISEVCKARHSDELAEAVQEYCPLMSAAISRSGGVSQHLTNDLVAINSGVRKLLDELAKLTGDGRKYWALGHFLTINAALSRFTSQTFAGTSPIHSTECHFWRHSLLGIGLSTLALKNICAFIEGTLGAARLDERFAKLSDERCTFDLTKELPPDADYLGRQVLTEKDDDVPLLACFSARDGYRSTEWAVSAPLAAVSACNSKRWSLLTLTHEFCHVVIRAIQAELYPDLDNPTQIKHCMQLIAAKQPASDILNEIRRMLLFSIIDIDDAAQKRSKNDSAEITSKTLPQVLQRWRHDVDEILVHVFDFLYFYGQDVDRYVAGIWASWGAIPNITHRVQDYVVRTVCAVLVKHLRRGDDAEIIARDQVLGVFKKLQPSSQQTGYMDSAIALLESGWEQEIYPRVRARRQLVKVVNSFLFSEAVATAVRGESEISSGTHRKEGYHFNRFELEDRKITNPLRFLEIYTTTLTPNHIDAAWMLYVLAFAYTP